VTYFLELTLSGSQANLNGLWLLACDFNRRRFSA